MVVGNGLIAKLFSSYLDSEDVLIFASGVSNSTETDIKKFQREFDLLKKIIVNFPEHQLIYFSTLSIEDKSVKERPYIKHKLQLEKYISNNSSKYLISRVSNVIGLEGNPNTIVNYLVNAVKNNLKIDVWSKAERNVIGAEDVKFIVDELIKKGVVNKTINIASKECFLVTGIVKQIELYLQKKARVTYLDKGNTLNIDILDISLELEYVEKKHGKGVKYLQSLLKKYY